MYKTSPARRGTIGLGLHEMPMGLPLPALAMLGRHEPGFWYGACVSKRQDRDCGVTQAYDLIPQRRLLLDWVASFSFALIYQSHAVIDTARLRWWINLVFV